MEAKFYFIKGEDVQRDKWLIQILTENGYILEEKLIDKFELHTMKRRLKPWKNTN